MTSVSGTNLLTAEVRKVATLKFWWALALPPVFVGICAAAISAALDIGASELGGGGIDGGGIDGVVIGGLLVALACAMLFSAVFSAVNAGTEFRHDTITTSFLTTSGRDRVIAAKLAVTAMFALGYGLIVAICSVLCLLLFTAGTFTLNGEVFAYVAAGLLGVVLWAVIGFGLGLLFGSPTWSSIVIVAWFPFGESILLGILAGIGADALVDAMPMTLTFAVMAAGQLDDTGTLAPWPLAPLGLAVWALIALTAGWYRARERDIA